MKKLFLIVLLVPLCGLWFIGKGSYIHAKANLAQVLLQSAWSETLHGKKEARPWPWADTWPVGRLRVPRLGISRIVLAGANGASLAFGPGHLFDSVMPGAPGRAVIAGHRDTHFNFLRNLAVNDRIEFLLSDGINQVFLVEQILIMNKDEIIPLADDNEEAFLVLVTCYPFAAIEPNGPLRYVIIASHSARYRHA